ncbi:hypothetical protein [Alkalibacillus aidingensis]|uniref:hypothetical protein n=1 Tax=Alkalibacillus aidingensis TaxID=2747607 RepID=UPI001660373C|nr:hypothetical protein [Alkalibacillus aidingensis]
MEGDFSIRTRKDLINKYSEFKRNRILASFIEKEKNFHLLNLALQYPARENKEKVQKAFENKNYESFRSSRCRKSSYGFPRRIAIWRRI